MQFKEYLASGDIVLDEETNEQVDKTNIKDGAKKLTKWQLINDRNLKILVPTPHNCLGIRWGRDKNFQVSMIFDLLNRKNKISLTKVFCLFTLYLGTTKNSNITQICV